MLTALIASALLGWTPLKIEINVRDVKDGDVISAEKTFRVTVVSDNPVTQVEFYVGDSLRDSDSSTPYEFKIDPLNEKEGPYAVGFVAYTSEGEKARKDLKLAIDTGVSKGAEFHVEQGNEFLSDQKLDDAIRSGRVALKAKADYNPARILLARAYLAKGVMDKAEQFAQDALAADANFAEGRELLAAINLRKALGAGASMSNRDEAMKLIASAMKQAAEYRRQNLDRLADAVGEVNDENRLRSADTFLRTYRFDAAVKALQPDFIKDPKRSEYGNRIAYAQLRSARTADAYETLRMMDKAGSMDAYGYAMMSVAQAIAGDDTESDKAMTEAVGNDPENLGVRTAQVFVALWRGRTGTFGNLANNLAKEEGQRTEVNYYLAVLLHQLRSFTDSDDRFGRTLLAEPANADMYVERGNQAIEPVVSNRITDKDGMKYQFDAATAYYEAALAAWPESPQALAAVAFMKTLQGKPADAVSYADATVRAGSYYPAGYYTASMVYYAMAVELANQASIIRRDAKNPDAETRAKLADLDRAATDFQNRSTAAKAKAEELDPKKLGGRSIPRAIDVYGYFTRYGRLPQLTRP
jgi:tetratricopeptide (TPR) repeat protein